jgi:bla regulator protein BlaR1
MQDPVFYTVLMDKFVPALCWTLVHSLWQGLAFAVLAGVVMLATKRSGAVLRYNALTCIFALFVLVAAGTFIREWNHHFSGGRIARAMTQVHTIVWGGTGGHPAGSTQTGPVVQTAESGPIWQQVANFLSDHALLIVAIWFLIAGIRVARTGYCMIYTQRLKTHRSHPPAEYWVQRLASLRVSMGIRKTVMLLESEVMMIPAVFGHLKPVIFVPIGLLAQIPPSQVEAMLIHELAHIRRNDFLVNFLQGLIGNIFFFNPAVLWISSLIREAREHCCDDVAIGQIKDKRQFIETLISLTERQVNNGPAYVLGFPGSRGGSAGRVARIVSNNNKTLNMKESFFLGLGLLLVGSLTLGFTGGRQAHTPPTVAPAAVQQVVQTTPPIIVQDAPPRIVRDTLHPVGGEDRYLELRINSAHDLVVEIMLKGVDYRFRRVNGTISNLFIDNKEIPKDEISKYSEITEKICRNADEHFSHPHLDEEASEARKLDLAAELAREAENRELVQHYMELQQKMAAQQQRAMESQLKEQLEKQQAILESQNLQLKRMNDTLEVKEAEMKLIIASIRADLINLHVVANPEEIKSFSLNKETLIVNGIRQPAEVHRHFKVKYLNDEIPEIRWDGLDLIRSDARP